MARGNKMIRALKKRWSSTSCSCWSAPLTNEFDNGQKSGPGNSRSWSIQGSSTTQHKVQHQAGGALHVLVVCDSIEDTPISSRKPSGVRPVPSTTEDHGKAGVDECNSSRTAGPIPAAAATTASLAASTEKTQEPAATPPVEASQPTAGNPVAQFAFGSSSEQNSRSHMEDRHIQVDLSSHEVFKAKCSRAALAAVFDGHGGHQAAELLVSFLPQQLLQQADILANPGAALEAAVLACESAVLSELTAGGCDGAGSTLVAVLLIDEAMYTANVGDCRAVLAQGAEAVQVTRDHKPSCTIEQARISAADPAALITNDGYLYGELAVGRALGSPKLKSDASRKALVATPELFTNTLGSTEDFLVLASDGLWDSMNNREVVQSVRRSLASERNADVAAAALVRLAVQLGSSDNITAVVVLLHDRPILLPKSNSRLFSRRTTAESVSDGGASRTSLSSSNSSISLMSHSSSSNMSGVCGGSSSNLLAAASIVE